ncbi:MAG: CatB-related O-acetyltransferase [Pseudomonadota bacterium]
MKVVAIYSRLIKKLRGICVRASVIHHTSKVESGSTVVNTVIRRHSFCGYDCNLINCDIGSFCSIGSRVSIGGARHPIEYVSTSPVFLSHRDSVKSKFAEHDYLPKVKTFIGNDVWIGEGVFIKAGISIGNGAVIGMGSVVTKNVPPYSIYAGNPAREVRKRFSDDIVGELLSIKWWDWPDAKLVEYGKYFNDPRNLITMIKLK